MSSPAARIGITGDRDHAVFGIVGDRLTADGYRVTFLDPTNPIPDQTLQQLAVYVPPHVTPATIQAIHRVADLDIPTWNSAIGITSGASRFTQYCLLEGVGFTVPETYHTKPETGDYVAQGLYHWSDPPIRNGDGDLYEEYLETDGVDYKYYVVDTGTAYRSTVLRVTSKFDDEQRVLGTSNPFDPHLDRITSLMADLSLRGVGVDLVRVQDEWIAVDLNLGPGFIDAGLAEAIVESIRDLIDNR